MHPLDPRITPARPDLAAKYLEGKVAAARFVEGIAREVIAPHTPVRQEPRPDAPLDTEALKGERVMVYETTEEGWTWGQLVDDGHVGWMATEALSQPGEPPTHRVAALRTLVFSAPSIKSPPLEGLPMGARLVIARVQPPFAETTAAGFIPLPHLVETTHREPDFVSVAERFAGAPYLWGGKTSLGLDCSALVQLALTASGRACRRDSDMQEETLGTLIEPASDLRDVRRGDLLFWPGHVAIARDADTLIHANGHHMAVAIEPIAQAVARNQAAGQTLGSVRRLL